MDYDLRILHILSSKVKVGNSRDAIGDLMMNPMETTAHYQELRIKFNARIINKNVL